MGVNLSDLPPEVRQRIEAEHGVRADGRTRAKPSRAETGPPTPGTCVSCGERLAGIRAFERHATTTGCSRFELDLEANEMAAALPETTA